MAKFADSAEYFTPDRALQEEVAWILEKHWEAHLGFLEPLLMEHGIRSVIEFGCGTGHLAAALPGEIEYGGVDKNPWFLRKARSRNPNRVFFVGDIRLQEREQGRADLAMAWNFLKNFSLDEFDAIVAKICQAGRCAAFNVQVIEGEGCLDNGTDMHHIFVSEERLAAAVLKTGHAVTVQKELASWKLEDGRTARDVALWTRENRIEAEAEAEAEAEVTAIPAVRSTSFLQQIDIAGKPMTDLHRFSIRWTQREGQEAEPVLYKEGRRVTQPWRIRLGVDMAGKDEEGNANTAD